MNMKKSGKLSKETVYLLKKMIEFDKSGIATFRPAQVESCIRVLEDLRVKQLMVDLKVRYKVLINAIRSQMADPESRNLPFNNPWHKLGWLVDDMVFGRIPDCFDKNEKEIWMRIEGFYFINGILVDIRFQVMIMILIEFGDYGLELIGVSLRTLFKFPIYVTSINGLPSIQLRERMTFAQVRKWMDDNKDLVQGYFDRFNWRKDYADRENLSRDLQIVLMMNNGVKDLSVAKTFGISRERVQQILKEFVRPD